MNKWTGMIPESRVNVWFAAAPEGLSNLSWIARLPGSRGGSLRHQSQTKKRPRWLRKLGQMENCFRSYTIALWCWCCCLFFDFNKSMANCSVVGPLPPHPMVWVVVVGVLVVVVIVVTALVKSCSHSRSSSNRIIGWNQRSLALCWVVKSIWWIEVCLHMFVHMQLICLYAHAFWMELIDLRLALQNCAFTFPVGATNWKSNIESTVKYLQFHLKCTQESLQTCGV